DKILRESPPDFSYYKDCFVYILHLVTSINNRKKEEEIIKNKGFTPINKQLLQKRIYHYSKYINYLLDQNILIENRQYIVGRKSRGLKFKDFYNSPIKKIMITKYTLIKSILTKKKTTNEETRDNLAYLEQWWNKSLTIDIEGATEYLRSLYLDEVNNYDIEFPLEIYNSRMIPVDRLFRNDYIFEVDNTAGRLHTWLTQVKSDLRKFVKYEGQTLCNIDITNSQPYLAISLLDQEVYSRNKMEERVISYNVNHKETVQKNKWITSTTGVNKYKTIDNNPIILVKKFANELHNKDVILYKELVSKGIFYEEFGKILKENDNITITNNVNYRSEAKSATFSAFFSPNTSISYKPEMKNFKQSFPTVYKIFSFYKKGKNQHNTLACSLQGLEAELILHKICGRISEEYPHIPLYTIHDSIVTTTNYSNCVKIIMEEELEKAIGLKPQIKIEVWE
ncbi:hypothetical protein N9H15_02570, partial [bacterium]|nr:hypothetical protein [bacterium]